MSNGIAISNGNGNVHKSLPIRKRRTRLLNSLMGFLTFAVTSIIHIVQAVYWYIFGHPQKSLRGHIALVTGGGSGLGRLLALRLARLNCKVILWDINKEGLDETCKLVSSLGGTCKGYVVDLANREDVYRAAGLVKEEVGRVSLLINNAGVVSGKRLLETPDHLIQRTIDVNILAHFWTTKAFLPAMVAANDGHIVTIASMAGHVGIPKLVDYCTSKFAAVGFDESLRAELETMGVPGVHTTVICPFFIQSTGMFEEVNARFIPQLKSNEVADRILLAIRANEKFAIIPGYLQIMLCVKWMFPWGCVSGFLRGLVPDAVPNHELPQTNSISPKSEVEILSKPGNDIPIKRAVASEKKP